ncbi:MAG: hypothetical protein AAGA16_20150 [Cyanobacteria bacterium P01_E01_bin.35]
MTTLDMASAVNSLPKTQFIEEIALIIAAQDLTPTMMSPDFLKFSGIVPQEWELAQDPVLNPNFAQLNFTNGIGISAKPRTITISESLSNKKTEELALQVVAEKYIHKLPHAEYVGLSFSPKILLPFPEAPQSVRQYITGNLLGSGSWKRIGTTPVQAGINLLYYLERCQLTISISEAKLQKPQEQPITAILFSGNYNYNVIVGQDNVPDKTTQIINFLHNWVTDLEEFREIVHQKFLDVGSTDSNQSIGETSLFPGQTL